MIGIEDLMVTTVLLFTFEGYLELSPVNVLSSDSDFDFDSGLDVDDDLLHDFGWRIETVKS